MRAIIFANGEISDLMRTARWLEPGDYLICADGGARHCQQFGLRPHALIGDMDSIPPELLSQWADGGVLVERHPPDKNETDLELAIEFAVQRGAKRILLLGALGGRLDHTMGNILLLARASLGTPIFVADGAQLAQVLVGPARLVLDAPEGSTVSVIALSDQVTGITYRGLEYPLDHFTLPIGSTRGMSNVVSTPPATIQIEDGRLLVVQTFDGQ
jgi:thiamine pyrophosphokinase